MRNLQYNLIFSEFDEAGLDEFDGVSAFEALSISVSPKINFADQRRRKSISAILYLDLKSACNAVNQRTTQILWKIVSGKVSIHG
jgi:hypothetical protein